MAGSLGAEDANNADETHDAEQLAELAELIRDRNAIDNGLGAILDRPATVGDIGEWIAAKVFDIELAAAANNTAFDGYFTTGSLSGRTVNVKTYLRQHFTLDMTRMRGSGISCLIKAAPEALHPQQAVRLEVLQHSEPAYVRAD